MSWANFDDNYTDHPKVSALSDGAFRLHTSGIVYCARYLTDGLVPKQQVAKLTPNYRAAHLKELLKGPDPLWTTDGNHFYIHDYLEWNSSKAEIQALHEAKSKAGKKGAASRWRGKGGR